jgi:membrane-bound inhibitor of C-type lysozyme
MSGWLPSTFCVRYINKSQVLDPKYLHMNLANTGLLERAMAREQEDYSCRPTRILLYPFDDYQDGLSFFLLMLSWYTLYFSQGPRKKDSGSRGRGLKIIILWRLSMKTTCHFSCSMLSRYTLVEAPGKKNTAEEVVGEVLLPSSVAGSWAVSSSGVWSWWSSEGELSTILRQVRSEVV